MQALLTSLCVFFFDRFHVIAAASALIALIQKESDNNVKLIVLDRVDTLQQKHEHVLDGLTLDILGVLSRLVKSHRCFYRNA